MPMLDADDLAGMRETNTEAHDITANVERPTSTENIYGTRSEVFAVVHTAVPCEIVPSSLQPTSETNAYGGRIMQVRDWVGIFDFDLDIRLRDEVVATGKRYKVVGISDDESYATGKVVRLTRLT